MTAGTPEVGPVDNSAKGLPALNQRGDDGRPLRRSRWRCQQIPLDHDIAPSTSPSAFSVEVEQRFAVGQHWVQNSLHFCGVEARMWGETGLHQIVPQTETSMPSLQKAGCGVCLWRRWGDSDAAPEAWFPGGRYVGGGGDGRHDIAVPLLAWGDGGARGSPPRPKLSTIIMRPPQQGHGGR